MDLLPTFAQIADAKIPADRALDGVSLRGVLLNGEKLPPRRIFFGYEPKLGTALRDDHFKAILKNSGQFELYDLSTDIAERLQGVRVRDLTWFGVAHASTETDADTMLWQRSRLGEAGIVAIERPDGELAGIVSEEQLLAVPEWRRPSVSLASLMVPMNQIAQAQLDEELANVLPRLSGKAPFVTVWREGKLLGVVPRRKLLGRLKAAQS